MTPDIVKSLGTLCTVLLDTDDDTLIVREMTFKDHSSSLRQHNSIGHISLSYSGM